MLARIAALAVAVLSWSAVAWLLADSAGVLARGETATLRPPAPPVDPCALREPLPTANDSRCTFELGRPDGAPLVVDLDQRWSGNTLTQWLNVREPDRIDPVHFVFSQTAGVPQPTRILRLFPVRWAGGEEQLVYMVGRCGGTACGTADLIVVGGRPGPPRVLLSWRLGRLADVEVRDPALLLLEGSFPEGSQRPDGMVARRFEWDGTTYALRSFALLPAPTPTPAPR